ncbi:MAG TPA: CBS domain-containing protein [Bryobacteraceae bacterium]|nr:CBS domain-containing protein [Bryobacteraceae bacterium]
MADAILYLTELLGLRVYDLKGRTLGVIRDAAIVPLIHPSRIDRFLVGGGRWAWLTIRHDQVKSISFDGIFLKDEQLTPYHSDEYMLRMVRDLLDQQIIDSQGRKVVRVTDVTFALRPENGDDALSILEVDVGLRSIFRRLMQGVMPRPWIRRLQGPIPPNSISWEVCNILEPDPQRRLRLNITGKLLEQMHPADLADIVEELSPEDREAVFETLDSEVAAETLSEVDPDIQASILESLETEVAADIVEEMPPDEAADVLAELEEETSQEILDEMEVEPKTDVSELLEFEEDTAGGMMNTEYVALRDDAIVAQAMGTLKENEELLETLNTIFLIDEAGRLTGSVPLARLFLAVGETPLRSLASDDLIRVDDKEERDRVTELFDKYNLLNVPVVDQEGVLSGVITADDVISVLRNR